MNEPFILFQIADTTYAVRAAQVQHVAMIEQITRVPNTPDFVEGVVHIRGKIVPVVSLRRRFGFDPRPYDLRSRLLVLDLDGRVIGLAVDSAREFINLDVAQIQPPPEFIAGVSGEYLEGVIPIEERLLLVLDLQRVLSVEEREALTN